MKSYIAINYKKTGRVFTGLKIGTSVGMPEKIQLTILKFNIP
jgi:hypothetical protein